MSTSCAWRRIAASIDPLEEGVCDHAHDLARIKTLLIEVKVERLVLGLLASEANLKDIGETLSAVDDPGPLKHRTSNLSDRVGDAVRAIRAELRGERALRQSGKKRRVEGLPGERGQIAKLIEILRKLPRNRRLAGGTVDIHRDGVSGHSRGERPLYKPSRVFGEFGRLHFHGERR